MDAAAKLDEVLRGAIEDGAAPGCVALVWRDGAQRYLGAHGRLASDPAARELASTPVTPDTVYDLASLTKVLATTTLIARSVGRGRLALDHELPDSLAIDDYRPTLRDLLEHAAGLEAHREFFDEPWSLGPARREALIQALRTIPPATAPRTRAIYSDLGFLLLGTWLELHGEARLDTLFLDRVTDPLGVAGQIGFLALDRSPLFERKRIAPTEVYRAPSQHWHPLRRQLNQRVAHGIVHDDNCVVMNGVAGHAGLFGTAAGVLAIARAWLERRLPGIPGWAQDHIAELFGTASTVSGSTRRLGFDGIDPNGEGSTGAALRVGAAIGHLGFTGTSVWIDREREAIYVLLSNRVHPGRDNVKIQSLRKRFHAHAAAL